MRWILLALGLLIVPACTDTFSPDTGILDTGTDIDTGSDPPLCFDRCSEWKWKHHHKICVTWICEEDSG